MKSSFASALGSLAAAAALAQDADLPPELESLIPRLPVWDVTFNLRGGGGFKDNVMLSAATPEASSFLTAGLDIFLLRLPTGGPEFNVMLTGDDRRYLDVKDADKEQTLFAGLDFKQAWGSGWKTGATAQYFYFNQVFDASTTEDPDLGIVKAIGHNVTLRPNVVRQFGTATSLALEGLAGWQFFEEPLDSHQDFGGRLLFRRETGYGATFELAYEYDYRPYDTRNQTTSDGQTIPDTQLIYQYQRVEGWWRHRWGDSARWRTGLRLGAEINHDNSSGYYDFRRLIAGAQIRYVRERWNLQANLRINQYQYDQQTTNFDNPELRHKLAVIAAVRAEWAFVKRLRLYAEFERERSDGNDAADQYTTNTFLGGLDFEF